MTHGIYHDDETEQVEKVLDAKWFKMEKERWPDGFDPSNFADNPDNEDGMDDEMVSSGSLPLFVRGIV